jgi:hypothetical protein
MTMKREIGIGETVLDILFKDDQPQKAVPGGSTFNSIVSLGRAGGCRRNTDKHRQKDRVYFPMQKRPKMDPSTSSVVISPVMEPR